MMRRLLQGLALAVPLCAPGSSPAQSIGGPLDAGSVQAQVLVVDFDRLFAESAFGLRLAQELEAAGAEIAAENRQIEAELTAEEQRLTVQRDGMEPDAFRALAQAFDEKVQSLRQAQDAKARALGQRNEEAQRRFLGLARPVLLELQSDAGAAVILERRAVLLFDPQVDVTDQAIARINDEIGDGASLTVVPPASETTDEAAPRP